MIFVGKSGKSDYLSLSNYFEAGCSILRFFKQPGKLDWGSA